MPLIDEGGLAAPYTRMGSAEAERVLYELYGFTGAPTPLPAEKDDTFRIDSDDGRRYVLKVANPAEDQAVLVFQNALLQHVRQADPELIVPEVLTSCGDRRQEQIVDAAGQRRWVRLMSYLDGTPLDRTKPTADQGAAVGTTLARLRLAMAGFAHPADSRLLAWDVRHVLELSHLVRGVPNAYHRALLAGGLERVRVLQDRIGGLRTQVLHNDFSLSNLVVDQDLNDATAIGVIDFGDAVRTAVAIDVSTALLNQLPRDVADNPPVDLFAAARHVLRGYLSLTDLTDVELELVPHLVMARVIARGLITTWRASRFPENADYILRNTEPGWAQLEWFLDRSLAQVSATLRLDQPSGSMSP